MTTYERPASSLGSIVLTLLIAAALVFAVIWFMGHNHHTKAGNELHDAIADVPAATSAAASHTSIAAANTSSAASDLSKAGDTASSALSKAGAAASVAVSETSADIKAAVNKQKQQESAESRSN